MLHFPAFYAILYIVAKRILQRAFCWQSTFPTIYEACVTKKNPDNANLAIGS